MEGRLETNNDIQSLNKKVLNKDKPLHRFNRIEGPSNGNRLHLNMTSNINQRKLQEGRSMVDNLKIDIIKYYNHFMDSLDSIKYF